jgi:serine/threonine-protein kinase
MSASPHTLTADGSCFPDGFAVTQPSVGAAGRSTVLPKIVFGEAQTLSLDRRQGARYREGTKLGAGGLGEVTLAVDEDIGREVAIKRLHHDDDDSATMRFVDEVQVMGRLDHPNIVPVHDVGRDDDGRLFFVMKRLDGETLESIIEKLRDGDVEMHARFPIQVRIEIMQGILHALQFAHAKRTIHRDLKPSNVMIGKYGEVSVVDWGIAKRLDDPISDALDDAGRADAEAEASPDVRAAHRTREGVILGTPAYMSPEQSRGQNDRLDERSDVFSACVMFYELLSLHHPFGGRRSVPEIIEAIRNEAPEFMPLRSSWKRGTISVELGRFVHRGLEKDPDDRFQSVGEMIESLHEVVEGTFPVTCPVTLLKRGLSLTGRVIDSYPRATGTLFLLTVLAALVGVVAIVARLLA